MALIDLKSDLSWYGTVKPRTNAFSDSDVKGFKPNKQALDESDIVGITGTPGTMLYGHTGHQDVGILGTANYFTNDHNDGFTLNIMPVGSGRPDSQFKGISGTQYESTSLLGTLSNLSNLSRDREDTKFIASGDSFSRQVMGFSDNGDIVSIENRVAKDAFAVNDATFFENGTARRSGQLGDGSPFVGHLGWNKDNKYSNSNDGDDWKDGEAQWAKGLAFKYTANTPIDDMYEKFNLREDAHDPYGYAKPPFILRGIQRAGEGLGPQRWGLGDTVAGAISSELDLPRGGILTYGERAALDAVRIGKFLIRPRGISFLAKQFGMQLMNPNVEGPLGTAADGLASTTFKVYDPLSSIAASVAGGLGIRSDRQFPPIVRAETYTDVHNKRITDDLKISQNRLNLIRKELLSSNPSNVVEKLFNFASSVKNKISGTTGQEIKVLTGLTGPASVGGIGSTSIKRYVSSGDLDKIDKLADIRKDATVVNKETNETVSTSVLDFRTGKEYDTESTKSYLEQRLKKDKKLEKDEEFSGGGKATSVDDSGKDEVGKKKYKTTTYKQIQDIAADRDPNSTKINDFRRVDADNKEYNGGDLKNPDQDQLVSKTKEVPAEGGTAFKDKVGQKEGLDADGQPLSSNQPGHYKVLGYLDLKRDNVRSFSRDSKKGFSGTKYSSDSTLEGKYGYPSFPRTRASIKDQPDPIQDLDMSDYGDVKDLINFKFQALRTTDTLDSPTEEPIIFRAFINSLNDSFQPGWEENQDQGRADAKIMMNGWNRTISVDFIVPVFSASELDKVWLKLEHLAKLTYPVYASSGFTGTYVKTTIGSLYKGEAMYVTDLSYDWDNETPWEISSNLINVPLYTNVSMTLGWIGKHRPDVDTHVFSWNAQSS